MHFRTVSDLYSAVRRNAHRLPRDIDLVVGVPRSGILAACAVSLVVNRPYTDLQSFINGQDVANYSFRKGLAPNLPEEGRISILLVDDSINRGLGMRVARERLEASGRAGRVVYVSVYGSEATHKDADIVLEKCPMPNLFEWNVMNHWALEHACVDIDGVLCCDPPVEDDDDGPRYAEFLKNAPLMHAPKHKINSIVTSRLEKYRPQTIDWLNRHGIEFGELYMLDLNTLEERRRQNASAAFKARIYKERKDCMVFIESDLDEAIAIRTLSGKNVLALNSMEFFSETSGLALQRKLRRNVGKILPPKSKAAIKSLLRLP